MRFVRLFRPLFLVFLGIIAACLCVEGILRFTDQTDYNTKQNDPKTGLLLFKPGISYHVVAPCFENTVQVNQRGLNTADFTDEKPPGVFRIVIVGSSFVEAAQIPQTQTFSALLEKQLNEDPKKIHTYQVIPYGFPGNGTYLDFIYYTQYVKQLKPDLVIDFSTEYELSRNAPAASYYPARFDADGKVITEIPRLQQNLGILFLKNLAKSSKLAMRLQYSALQVSARTSDFLAQPHLFGKKAEVASKQEEKPSTEGLWEIETRLISQYAQAVQKNNAHFLLATWFNKEMEAAAKDDYAARYRAISRQENFDYDDLTPALTAIEAESGKSPVWSCDGHWNELGHTWAAQELKTFLEAHPALLQTKN